MAWRPWRWLLLCCQLQAAFLLFRAPGPRRDPPRLARSAASGDPASIGIVEPLVLLGGEAEHFGQRFEVKLC